MKNLFKNLMLVAVAAMAFTACTETNDEVNAVVNKTRYEFTANIAEETRSGFTEKEEGATAYKSEWFGNETLKIFVTDYNSYNVETTADINAEGQFDLELENAPESFFMTVVSPAESWASEYTATIPTEQTPLANSVDPKAHLLQAQAVPVSGGQATINLNHMAAYGKMTVKGVDFAIDHVVVDLKGTFYNYARELSYTINATNVENNTFWFATEPIDVAEFTVTAYGAEGKAVTKTVDVAEAGKTMSFQYGRVGTFSVSGLEEYTEVVTYDYDYAYISKSWGSTDKLVTFTGEGKENLNVNFAGRSFDGNAIAAGTYYYNDGVYNYGISLGNYDYGSVTAYVVDSVVVSIVDGCYVMEFNGLADYYGETLAERLTFKGTIDGLGIPDPRARLATPEVTYELNGKTLTVSWTPVDGAVGYYVHDYYNEVDTTTTETTLTVNLSEYKWYYIYVTALAADDDANFKDSDEAEISFELKDPRQILANPTNLAATVDGKYATITWDPVQGADYYYVEYYLDGNQSIEVTDASVTLEIGYSKSVTVYVQSRANDDNPDYRSSTSWDGYVQVNTDKDPDKFADVVANKIIWDSSNGAFKMTGEVVSGTAWGHSSDYIRLYINESDRPGNNSIKVGTYTGCSSTSPQAGQFGARLSLYWGNVTYPSAIGSQSTVEVSYDEAVGYTIVLTHNNVTYGYKGMPDGWVAPAEGGESGGDEPENPDPEQLGSEANPYTFTSVASNGFFLNFEGAENGASLQLDRQNSDVNVMSNYGGPFALNYTAIIYGGSGNIYNVGGNTYYYASFAPYSTLEVTKADGNWTCKLKMSVDAGATYTYYTYTGQIANQAY